MIHNLRAIVLWSRRSRDADKIVGLFTNQLGRVTAKATSAAKSMAKFAAITEPFVESEIALYLNPPQGWGKVVGGRLTRSFPGLRTRMDRTTAASWVCEIVFRLTPVEQPSPEKFELLRETLAALEQAPCLGTIRLAFAVRFLSLVGLGLDHRDAWMNLIQRQPEQARALLETPLLELAECDWKGDEIRSLEQLAGSVVYDHLNRPLQVNRFRQMTGVEI